MLFADATTSAAIELLGADVGYMISHGQNGICLASVMVPGTGKDVTAEGATIALALLGAFTLALVERPNWVPAQTPGEASALLN